MTLEYEYDIAIGAAPHAMVNIESLNGDDFPPPLVTFYDYVETSTSLDGGRRAHGLPHFTLEWGNLTVDQREALRVYCPDGVQAVAYLTVPTNTIVSGSEYQTYQCNFAWPNAGQVERELETLKKFVIECTEAVLV